MKPLPLATAAVVTLGLTTFWAQTPQAPASADPDAGTAAPGTSTFPLAAPAGRDRNARAINIVHDAAVKAGTRLCGPLAWRDRTDVTCFRAGSETAAIARGVAAELGPLANTQGKPEVDPFAATPAADLAAGGNDAAPARPWHTAHTHLASE